MKIPVPAGLLACCAVLGGLCRAVAQDVTVGPLRWAHDSEADDVLPVQTGLKVPKFPDDLRKTTQLGWAEMETFLDKHGKVEGRFFHGTLPYYEDALEAGRVDRHAHYQPARQGRENIPVLVRQTFLFNPASAATDRPDATPRLLDASVIVDPALARPPEIARHRSKVLWVRVSLDDQGEVTGISGVPEPRAQWLATQLRAWRFAPARRANAPIAADVLVPVIIDAPGGMWERDWTPPEPISREPPVFPQSELRESQSGLAELEFIVDRKGDVRDAVVVRMTTDGFGRAALNAIKKWKYEPARVHGQAITSSFRQTIEFSFNGEGNTSASLAIAATRRGNGHKLPAGLRYDLPPVVRRLVQPKYPYDLLRQHVGGFAEVLALVDAQGKVTASRVIKADRPEFGGALQAAVEQFEYQPALKDGDPTPTMVSVSEQFEPDPERSLMFTAEEARAWTVERKHPEQVAKPNELDRHPTLTYAEPPQPPRSLAHPTGGQAMVEFLIGERGEVLLPRVVSCSAPAFGFSAVQAVADWCFSPPTRHGKPVLALVRVPINFEAPAK